jgi:NADH:ubiquinone oxidoreductase subunit 5 (subunit L)/multisubunit Na+/H+ antiporter MnhA subunit
MAFLGGITAIFSAICCIFQNDIKKIIAYSTCSQLGYMFFACGFSNYNIALYHLFNHAFFKALLFLGAGVIIHCLFDEQDMRKMGRLIYSLPLTYTCILIGALAISGFPFLTGYYSKDLILESTYGCFVLNASFIYYLGSLTAFFTAVYCSKILIQVFFYGESYNHLILKPKEDLNIMLFCIIILAVCSIFIGYLMSDALIG